MISADVRFAFNKDPEVAFTGRGQVALYDTCLVVSGPLLRFRLPFINRIFEGLLTSPSYRTIPYGAVEQYSASFTLRRQTTFLGVFRRLHTVKFRLPSGKVVRLLFRVIGTSDRERAFRAALNENLTATKALFVR